MSGNAIAFDRDINASPVPAATVIDRAVSNDDIVILGENRRSDQRKDQRAFHGAIQKAARGDVDLIPRLRHRSRADAGEMCNPDLERVFSEIRRSSIAREEYAPF